MSDNPLTLNLVGTIYQGPPGNDGDPGKSTYEIYVDTTSDNPVKTELEWIESQKGLPGEKGDSAYLSYVKTTTDNPVKTEAEWITSLQGEPGEKGDSAYISYVKTTSDNPVKTEAAWVASLVGADGKSSYQSYVDTTSDDPVLSEADWVESLHGKDGTDGTGLRNREAWLSGTTYNPGDYVFSNNAAGNNSMWILSGNADYVSTIAPKDDPTHWIEFQAPAGAAGVGVSGIALTYQASASGTVTPTGAWSSTIPAVTKGQYLWTRAVYSLTNGTSSTGYSVAYQGADGTNGSAGRGISSSAVTYQASTSGTVTPTGTWTSTVPAVTQGQYLWTRTILTLTDATTVTSYGVSYAGKDGSPGAAGLGITSATTNYQVGTSGTVAPTGTWTTAMPSVPQGQFLWTRVLTTFSDNTFVIAYSVAYQGMDGSGGSGSGGTTWLNGTTDPTGSTGAAGNYYQNTSTCVVWYRATTSWAAIGVIMPIATTDQAKEATSNLVLMTPAHVREYMEQYGLTATYTTQATDLNLVVRGAFFNYSGAATGGTANIPVAGTYGRGFCIPSGDGYATQFAIENDTGKCYVRFQTAGTWGTTWTLIGPSSGGGGGGTTVPAAYMAADVNSISSTAAVSLGFAGTVLPANNSLYMFKAVILTQGLVGGSFNLTFDNMGAQIFRMSATSADSTGVLKRTSSDQASTGLLVYTGATQEGVAIIEGIIQFNYVATTMPQLKAQCVDSSHWLNILKDSCYTLTPIAAIAS